MCYVVNEIIMYLEEFEFKKSLGDVERRYFDILLKALKSLNKKQNQRKVLI